MADDFDYNSDLPDNAKRVIFTWHDTFDMIGVTCAVITLFITVYHLWLELRKGKAT